MSETANRLPPFRTVVIADSGMAQPTFETLVQGGWVVGLCTSRKPLFGDSLRNVARRANLPIFQADRKSLAAELEAWLRTLRPDVILTFNFPYLLPPEVLKLPHLGAFNLHPGRLPEYRGPQPTFWQMAKGETEGAVIAHRMTPEYDHGDIIAAYSVPIAPEETNGLHIVQVAFAAVKVVEALFGGLIHYGAELPAVPQDESRAGFYPRPTHADLTIRWEEQTGAQIRALVKACNPWNQGAHTALQDNSLRLTDVTLIADGGTIAQPPGTILIADMTRGLVINCLDGAALQLDVVTLNEGIFPGRILAQFGVQPGARFTTLMRE